MNEPHQPDTGRTGDDSAAMETLIGRFADELREIPRTADFAEESASLIRSYLARFGGSQTMEPGTSDPASDDDVDRDESGPMEPSGRSDTGTDQEAVELRRTLGAIAALEREGRRRQAGPAEPAGAGGGGAVADPGRVAFFFPIGEGEAPSIRGFRMVREIGRGGMGIVFEAQQIALRRRVAVKILPVRDTSADGDAELPSLGIGEPGPSASCAVSANGVVSANHGAATEPCGAAGAVGGTGASPLSETGLPELSAAHETPSSRFMREARIIARLHHTNIVPVLEAGCERGLHWYAMQLIRGRSLDHLVRAVRENDTAVMAEYGIPAPHTPAYFRRVCEFFLQVTDALAYVHRLGLLHRDIKPGNLILEPGGRLWVTDFGLARVQEPDRERENESDPGDESTNPNGAAAAVRKKSPVGTLRYMAPEQHRGVATTRSDLYAVGLTLYEMFGLHAAFRETSRTRLAAQVDRGEPSEPLGTLAPELPIDLVKITEKAICPDPAGRYATAETLGDDLRRYLEGRPVHAHPIPAWRTFLRWRQRNPWIYFPVLTALTAVIVAVIVGWSGWLITHTALDSEALQRGQAERNLALSVQERLLAQEQRDRAEWNLSLSLDILDNVLPSLATRRAFAVYTIPSPDEREELETLLQFYEELTKANATNSRLRLEMARTLARIGTVRLTLGDPHSATAAFEESLECYTQLMAGSPPHGAATAASGGVGDGSSAENELWWIDVARIHNELGYSRRLVAGTIPSGPERMAITLAARHDYREALRILEPRKSSGAQLERIRSLNALGILTSVMRNMSETAPEPMSPEPTAAAAPDERSEVSYHREAVAVATELLKESSRPEYRFAKAQSQRLLVQSLRARCSEADRAEIHALAADSTATLRRLIAQNPEFAEYRKELAQTLICQDLEQTTHEQLSEAERITNDLVDHYPYVPEYQFLAAGVQARCGMKYFIEENIPAGMEQMYEAARHVNRLKLDFPGLSGLRMARQDATATTPDTAGPSADDGRLSSIPLEIRTFLRHAGTLTPAGDPTDLSASALPDTPVTLSEVLQTLGDFHDFFRGTPPSKTTTSEISPEETSPEETSPERTLSGRIPPLPAVPNLASPLRKVADSLEQLTRWLVY